MFRLLLSCLLLLSTHAAIAFSYTLEISEKEIQQRVTAMMPIQKSKFLLKVVLSDPKVSLVKDSNEVAISSPIYVTAPAGIKGSGSAKLQGSISYEAKSGEFFLKNPKIVEFQVNTLPQKYQQQAKLVVQAATENVLAKRSIYQFKDENLKQKLAKSILKSVTVKDQTMWIELGVL